MNRKISFTPSEYYHLYNRGVNKDKIFFSNNDWKYFQRLLYLRNDAEGHVRPSRSQKLPLGDIPVTKSLVDIQAYALMPNHFHLVLSEREAGGITTFMKRLSTSYSMYINNKYDRSGPLMCRPFRAKHVDSDEYMRWVISYIHLNPVAHLQADWEEEGIGRTHYIQQHLTEYLYCSYRDYYGPERDESVVLNKSSLPFFISDLEDPKNMLATYETKLVLESPGMLRSNRYSLFFDDMLTGHIYANGLRVTLDTSGPSGLLGRTWTTSEFSNADFAIRLTGSPSANTVLIDELQVRVYHQATGGGGGGGRLLRRTLRMYPPAHLKSSA